MFNLVVVGGMVPLLRFSSAGFKNGFPPNSVGDGDDMHAWFDFGMV